ncbi:hypothetical protein ACLOJK_017079 [Asimina triloba]
MGSSTSASASGVTISAREKVACKAGLVAVSSSRNRLDYHMNAKTKPRSPALVKWSFLSRSSVNDLNYKSTVCSGNCNHSPSSRLLKCLNGPLWSALEIGEGVNGEIVNWGPPGTVCTDSRKLNPGQWFFAIAGERFDGHDFINQALESKGCVGVVGNRACENWQRGFIRVHGDTSIALERLALYARNRYSGHVVGVTGSVGKTTTRTMIALTLESLGLVYQTHGNENNQIGVALTLIGIPASAKVSVLELGMNKKGEILELAQMSRPSVRVILNVGQSHMENFESLEEVARAKGELFVDARPGDLCVLNADDPLLVSIPVPPGVKKVLFGERLGSDVRLVLAESINGGCAVRVVLKCVMFKFNQSVSFSDELATEMVEFVIRSPGLHLALNACAAAAVAVSLGIPLALAGNSLSRFEPVHMRSELETASNGIKIVNDVYNANPQSMIAAINLLKGIHCRGKRVAVLGDMLELGTIDAEAHKMVLKMCCDPSIGLIAVVGKRFHSAAEDLNLLGSSNLTCAVDSESMSLQIRERLSGHDVVLVKGSRAMQMEVVVGAIKEMSI